MKQIAVSKSSAKIRILILFPVVVFSLIVLSSCNKKTKSADSDKQNEQRVAVNENAKVNLPEAPPPPPPPPAPDAGSEKPYDVVDQMPVFKGGTEALIEAISKNTVYPDQAKIKGIQGKVVVRFAVEVDGSVDKVSVLKGVDPDLDKEAVRVTSAIPDFEKPGIKDGKAVAVWYTLPIDFKLK